MFQKMASISDPSAVKLENNNQKITRKRSQKWKLKDKALNNSHIKEVRILNT